MGDSHLYSRFLSGEMSSSWMNSGKTRYMKDMLGVRHIQCVLLAGALLVNHVQQGNIGISAVAMTNQDHKTDQTYDWKTDQVTMSKGSYFYSVMISCFLSGYLTTKLDGKMMLLISTFIGTFLTYITPTLIRNYDWNIFFFIRLMQGAAKGFIRPLVYSQLVRWMPPDELMLIGPVVLSSVYLGNAIILMMGGYLSTGQGGWPSIFYFSGNIGFIWCLAYIGLGSQSPNSCFYISVYERRYIEQSLPFAIRTTYRDYIPWKAIFTCLPVYVLMITQAANNYASQSFIKIIPMFYQHSLGLDVKLVGLVMGLPFLVGCFVVYTTYFVMKFLIKRKQLNHSEAHHIFNGIGQFGAFYFFMYCAFASNYYLSFSFHCIGMLLGSFQFNGFYMNYIDLSPNYVGLVAGFVVGCAHITSILGPFISFTLYKYHEEDSDSPQSALRAKEAIYFFIAMFFLWSGIMWELLGSTKVQPFNDIRENEVTEVFGNKSLASQY
ncbi:putative inorganic phosphate cotransporter isoform X2 [Halyomorpha halys]|uniref:putative inorganic phosphate cotransporter isoform X2 n=1 Tax=Halyomorpha halys TaxID=286706 RepID=UPI0006D4FD38